MFKIYLVTPSPMSPGIHWPINITKEVKVSGNCKKKKNMLNFSEQYAGKGLETFVTNTVFTISRHLNCFDKLIGQWTLRGEEQRITRDIWNIHFHFQHSTKNLYKVGTFYKTEMLERVQFCNLPQLCIHFFVEC